MISQKLQEARTYEETTEKKISAVERPDYHLSTRVGWMNDPNGFTYYNRKYHLFYQYHPYNPFWGPMHWGHAVSEDLMSWEYLPAAMAPDAKYDRNGCFSGSAITLPDGKQLLMYTGVEVVENGRGGYEDRQRQCIAIGDGVDYEKCDQNPVLPTEMLPEGSSQIDFRDPKVLILPDGTYGCVVGSRPADGSGQILLYESKDAIHWTFKSVLAKNENRYGKMWECPDFFEMDGKWFLFVSPQFMVADGYEYHNGNGTVCFMGDFDSEAGVFHEESNHAIDYGIDFYAPQTVLTEDGRRIMIGWMQNWDTANHHSPEEKWFGQMTLPRELSLKDGRVYQWPIREIEEKRQNKVDYQNVFVDREIKLPGICGRRVDLELEIIPENAEEVYHKFTVKFAQGGKHYTALNFRPMEELMEIDRRHAGDFHDLLHQRMCEVSGTRSGNLKLRILMDRYSAEVFINDGFKAMTVTFYNDQKENGISFDCLGKARMNITKYDIVMD